jgi:hypothetical protein
VVQREDRPTDASNWVLGAGVDVTGPGDVLIDGLGMNANLDSAWVTLARQQQTGAAARAALDDEDDWDATVYGARIGWWY